MATPAGTKTVLLHEETVEIGSSFARVRKLQLQNVRPDGSRSRAFPCHFFERKASKDAVALLVYRRQPHTRSGPDSIEVLIREELRPTLTRFGRTAELISVPEAPIDLIPAVIAGILEPGDNTVEKVAERAAHEAYEEAGLTINPQHIRVLGGYFASPGLVGEKVWLCVAEVPPDVEARQPDDNPSAAEERNLLYWLPLREAQRRCLTFEICDGKTLVLIQHLAASVGLLP